MANPFDPSTYGPQRGRPAPLPSLPAEPRMPDPAAIQTAREEQTPGERAAFGPVGVAQVPGQPSMEELMTLYDSVSPTHLENLQQSLGPDARVRMPEGGEQFMLPLARGTASTLSDTAQGRVKIMDFMARAWSPGARVFLDEGTGMPTMQTPDGEFVPLEIPGFAHGPAEMAGDTLEVLAPGIPNEIAGFAAGAAASSYLGPGAFPVALVGGAIGLEGVRQGLQEVMGVDDETLNQMLSTVGLEAFGQMLGILSPRLARATFGTAGGRLTPAMQEALEAEKRLATGGFKYGLTPGELSTGAFNRLARQVNILSSRAQAFFGNRSVRLSAMLLDLPDPAMRGRWREFVERDFTQELERQQAAMLEAAGATVIEPAAHDAIRPQWRKMVDDYRKSTQAGVSAAYKNADELMANSGMKEDYFALNGPGADLLGDVASLRTRGAPPVHKEVARIMDEMLGEVKAAEKRGVVGMIDSKRSSVHPLTKERMERTIPVRQKLQNWAEQLYDVSADKSLPGLARKHARDLRGQVIATLESPVLDFRPGVPGNPDLARQAIDQHTSAREMAKARFETLEVHDVLGLTRDNARPVRTRDQISNAESVDDLLAIKQIHGGIEAVRDSYFTDLIADPRNMGEEILKAKPVVLQNLLDNDPQKIQRVLASAREIDSLKKTGAWDALDKQSRETSFARRMLFDEKSTTKIDELRHQIARVGGPDSELGRATETAIVTELLARSLDQAVPGADLAAETFRKELGKLVDKGVMDMVSPRVREILNDSSTLATFANTTRADSGSSLEAASTVARLRSGRFMKALGELGVAEGLAMVLTNPKATGIYASVANTSEPHVVMDLVAGTVGAILTHAVSGTRSTGVEPAGIE